MKPNKYKTVGLVLACILLAAALICKLAVRTESAVMISLPLLALGLWAIMVCDTLAYRATSAEGIQKRLEMMRLIGGWIVAFLVTAAIVILIVSGRALL